MEKNYHMTGKKDITEGKMIESKQVCLRKQNGLKQNFTHDSSPANLKYEPRE